MNRLLIATSNIGKFREFSGLMTGLVDQVLSLKDYPDMELPPEDGATFLDNALIKARHAAKISGIPTIADDSGLEVVALDGKPGVRSARYAGDDAGDDENNARLLQEMSEIPPGKRGARFVCCLAFCMPDGECVTFEGELKGEILREPRGTGGFGYDPLFFVSEYEKTLAELALEVKNSISHRAHAFKSFREYLAGR
jgi:XTP/dITP diphosphohydrolase